MSEDERGQGSEGTFTRARRGTLKGNREGKNIHKVVIDRVRKFETMSTAVTLWAVLPKRTSTCGLL